MLSPALFSVYIDNLLMEMRLQGLGCRVAGVWMAAVGFADDLLMMAPNRAAMEGMLEICEHYAFEHNLKFSTDPNPNKSKSKCVYMTGHRHRNVAKPANLHLNGRELPWVNHATHLGNELHCDANMDMDCNMKRQGT